jgi:N-acetylmuramoyl-L-alanine amidase
LDEFTTDLQAGEKGSKGCLRTTNTFALALAFSPLPFALCANERLGRTLSCFHRSTMLHLHTIVKRLVYLLVLLSCVVVVQSLSHPTFAQERINFLAFNGELMDDIGPYYFRAQGNTQDSYVRVDLLADKLGFSYSYDGQSLIVKNTYRTIELETTNNIPVGLEKRSDVLSVNGGFIPSPMGIVVNDVAYAAITPIMQAVGGESGWRGEEHLVWLHYDPSRDVPKPEPAPEATQPDAPPVQTQTTGATLGSPRIGLQEAGQTRVVIDLPPGSFYDLYAYGNTLIISLPQLGAAPFTQSLANDPNIEKVRYALVDNKLALVITTHYTLDAAGSGYKFALLAADETTGNERFYVEFSPNLRDKAINSAQGMQPQDLTAVNAQAPTTQQKVVVIDAGHGAHDPGAVSAYAAEKDVVLAIALKLKAYLEAQGIQVVMTRSDDTFLELKERAAFATPNINLFVAVHANSASESASGVETWVFGQSLSSNNLARAIEENGGGEEGQAFTQEAQQAAQSITGSIYRENQLQYSLELAGIVQNRMVAATGAKDRGVQQAEFYVIRNARSPSILVETGFVTNSDEGTKLTTSSYQDIMARAISEGIVQFLSQGTALAANQQQP